MENESFKPVLVEKIPSSSRTRTLRKCALDIVRDAKQSDHNKGVFVSMSDSGSLSYSFCGMGRSEAISTLEQAKHLILHHKWNT